MSLNNAPAVLIPSVLFYRDPRRSKTAHEILLEPGRQVTDVAHGRGSGKQAAVSLVNVFECFEFGAATANTNVIKCIGLL